MRLRPQYLFGEFRAAMMLRGGVLVATKATAFLATVLIARSLNSAEAGGFFFSLSLGTVLGLLLAFGVGETMSREVPKLDVSGRSHEARSLLIGSVRLVAMSAALGSVLIAILVRFSVPGKTSYLVAAVLVGIGLASQSLGVGFLRARSKYRFAETLTALAPTLFLIVLVPSIYWFGVNGRAALGVRVILEVIAGGAAIGGVLFLSRRDHRQEELGRSLHSRVTKTMNLSAPLWITSLCWLAIQQSEVVALGLFRDPVEVGIYAPILKVAEVGTLSLAALTPYLLPEASRLDAQDDHGRMQALYDSSTKWVLALGAPLMATLILVPRELIHLLLGIRAPEVATVSRLLAAAFLLFALFGTSEALLQANCRAGKLFRRSLVMLTGTVTINSVLVWRFGMMGAALGNLVAYTLFAAINVFLLRTELGIRALSLSSGRVLGVAALSTGLMGVLLTFIDGGGLSVVFVSLGVAGPTLLAALMPSRWSKAPITLHPEFESV